MQTKEELSSVNIFENFNNIYRRKFLDNVGNFFANKVKETKTDVEGNLENKEKIYDLTDNSQSNQKKLNLLKTFLIIMWVVIIASSAVMIYFLIQTEIEWQKALYGLGVSALLIIGIVLQVYLWKKIKVISNIKRDVDNQISVLKTECLNQLASLKESITLKDVFSLLNSATDFIALNPITTNQHFTELEDLFSSLKPRLEDYVFCQTGYLNDNPFMISITKDHYMGNKTYFGSLKVSWTETEKDFNGELKTVKKTQILEASVTKPAAFFDYDVKLNYESDVAPNLKFSRSSNSYGDFSDKKIEKLTKKTIKEINKNDVVAVANEEFETLFRAHNRNDEKEFRILFTSLVQQEMTKLLKSKVNNNRSFGNDFQFIKNQKINIVRSECFNYIKSKLTKINNFCRKENKNLYFDEMKESFMEMTYDYFRSIYFGLSPIMAIQNYQLFKQKRTLPKSEYPSYLPKVSQLHILNNLLDVNDFVPRSNYEHFKVESFNLVSSENNCDTVRVESKGFILENMVDYIPVRAKNGVVYKVPVKWVKYNPEYSKQTFKLFVEPDSPEEKEKYQKEIEEISKLKKDRVKSFFLTRLII